MTAPSSQNLSLDHALLYCIGVNLPSHLSGQLDRVLVLASPVNDVNIHAWNLNRVKRFIVIDAGIQMELCANCCGTHQKKVILFLLPSDFIEDCMSFLLHEMHATDLQPQPSEQNDPIIYNIPHQCGMIGNRSNSLSYVQQQKQAPSYCIDAEAAVLQSHSFRPPTIEDYRQQPPPVTSSQTQQPPANPSLPPRNRLRPNYKDYIDGPEQLINIKAQVSARSTLSQHTAHDHFEVPYHISQRIYINETGAIQHQSQVLGSGSGQFRGASGAPRFIVTESSKATGYNPVYISSDEIRPGPSRPSRPEFIGRWAPMLPPRSSSTDTPPPVPPHSSPPPPPRSSSPPPPQSSPTQLNHRRPPPPPPPPSTPPLTPPQSSPSPPPRLPPSPPPPSPPPQYSQEDIPEPAAGGYINVDESPRCTSALSLCTDDITNADFALMTRVTFKNIIPSIPPRASTSKQPIPTPRKHNPQKPLSNTLPSTAAEYSYARVPSSCYPYQGTMAVQPQVLHALNERPRSQSSGSLSSSHSFEGSVCDRKVSNEY